MKVLVAVAAVLLVGGTAYFLLSQKGKPSYPESSPASGQVQKSQFVFENPKKAQHYESNTPEHASILAGVPVNVVINFNFDLADNSSISVTKDAVEYGRGEVTIDDNKLSMRRKMDPNAPDGVYTVKYKACWPDKTCHDGSFGFAIDRSLSSGFEDMTGKANVTIQMRDIAFVPQFVKVSKETKITWVNNDGVVHYVNTDPHAGHNYYLSQNSQSMEKGNSYSLTFEASGIYLYHCSAHAQNMKAQILVE